jgi:PKD repeat protein
VTVSVGAADDIQYSTCNLVLGEVSPSVGPYAGGTTVTISGANFQDGASVYFGSEPATDVHFVDDSTLTAVTPAGSIGPVDVSVVNPDGTPVTLAQGYTFSQDDSTFTATLSAYPDSGTAPLDVTFTLNASVGDGHYWLNIMPGDGHSFSITVENGSPALSGTFDYTYDQPGIYQAAVVVTDGSGHMATTDPVTISVGQTPLTVSATATTTSGSAPLSAMFACAPHGGTPPYTYDWDFGDGTAHATNPSPAHVFESAGVYTVTLTVTDSATQTAVDDHIHVNVYGPLTFHLTAHPSSGTAPLEVHFTGAASDGDGDYTFGPIYYGDGTSGYGPHTYNQPGTYQATQTVSDGSGHTAPSAPVTITVLQAPVITSVSKAGSPFRLKVLGSHFLAGCVVKIDGQAVPQTKFKNDGKVVAKKGRMLKAMVPKGQSVTITVVNPDGGISAGYSFTR